MAAQSPLLVLTGLITSPPLSLQFPNRRASPCLAALVCWPGSPAAAGVSISNLENERRSFRCAFFVAEICLRCHRPASWSPTAFSSQPHGHDYVEEGSINLHDAGAELI